MFRLGYDPIMERRERRSLVQALLGDDDLLCESSSSHLNDKENILEWTWEVGNENEFAAVVNDRRDVKFHRNHSSGTAVVRGSTPMSHDQHFWEIEMISPVYGTDMMVGVGTPEADMTQLRDIFISRLGKDLHTWGFSYTGSFYHNGVCRNISTAFDQGSIIGVHLDMWNGTLSFYKNKRHLGVASKGLNGKTLYAMACSTAACSHMRILRSCSFPSSLVFLCCKKLRDVIPDDKNVLSELKFPPGLKSYLENNLSWLLNPRLVEEHPHKDQYLNRNRQRFLQFDFPPERLYSATRLPTQPRRNFVLMGMSHLLHDPVSPSNNDYMAPDILLDLPIMENEAEGEDEEQEEPIVTLDSEEDTDISVVREAKRRRCSYNYAVGLSDPDSDTES